MCKGGAIREVEFRAVANILPGLHLTVRRDITKRKRVEQDFQNRHSTLHTVIEGIPEAIYVKDAEGRYVLMNSLGARLVGITVQESIGRYDTD